MILFPGCKINLGLNIIRKRSDGYHDLETCFYPLYLTDALEIVPASVGKGSFTQSGILIPPDGRKNLCERAYDLLSADYDLPPVKIHLHKKTPIGAGLGGGSADAAYTLLLLNDLFELGIDQSTLLEYASMLGSDCAFFIINKPCLASGRGEILKPVEVNLSGYYLVLIKPDIHVSTAEAYAGIQPVSPEKRTEGIIQLPPRQWKEWLVNDFEKTVFTKHPQIGFIKKRLYEKGALYASMTGSGAAVFGIFEQQPELDKSGEFSNYFIWTEKL